MTELNERIELVPNREENYVKVLGINIDYNLNMKEHVKKLRTKIGRANFTLNQMKNVLDKKHLKLLVNAYVKSHIEYNCWLLSLCNKSTLKPLEIQFKKTIRILSKAKYRDHTAPLFKKEYILPIEKQIEFQALKVAGFIIISLFLLIPQNKRNVQAINQVFLANITLVISN